MADPFGGYTTIAILREYAAAHDAAKGNTSTQDTALCNERMFRIKLVDDAIEEIENRENVPQVLKDHLTARKDPGCSSCWASSIRSKNHPECNEKIDRWFKTRDALFAYSNDLRK